MEIYLGRGIWRPTHLVTADGVNSGRRRTVRWSGWLFSPPTCYRVTLKAKLEIWRHFGDGLATDLKIQGGTGRHSGTNRGFGK